MNMYAHMAVSVCVIVYACSYGPVHLCVFTCMHIQSCVCLCTYMLMHCVCVHVYVHVYCVCSCTCTCIIICAHICG